MHPTPRCRLETREEEKAVRQAGAQMESQRWLMEFDRGEHHWSREDLRCSQVWGQGTWMRITKATKVPLRDVAVFTYPKTRRVADAGDN